MSTDNFTPAERVYDHFTRALLSPAPVGPLAPVKGSDAHVAAGVNVYRNNVRAAYLRVLSDSFPVTERLVGEGFFRYAAHEYFHAYPPTSRLVARYGDSFPEFLSGFGPASGLPYLADVARLEIAWLQSYHAAEATPLAPAEIIEKIGERPEDARLGFHPSMRLLASEYASYSIWLHNHEKREGTLRLPEGGERAIIVRPEAAVLTARLSFGAYQAINEIAAGAKLGDATGKALEIDPGKDVDALISEIISLRIIISAELN